MEKLSTYKTSVYFLKATDMWRVEVELPGNAVKAHGEHLAMYWDIPGQPSPEAVIICVMLATERRKDWLAKQARDMGEAVPIAAVRMTKREAQRWLRHDKACPAGKHCEDPFCHHGNKICSCGLDAFLEGI